MDSLKAAKVFTSGIFIFMAAAVVSSGINESLAAVFIGCMFFLSGVYLLITLKKPVSVIYILMGLLVIVLGVCRLIYGEEWYLSLQLSNFGGGVIFLTIGLLFIGIPAAKYVLAKKENYKKVIAVCVDKDRQGKYLSPVIYFRLGNKEYIQNVNLYSKRCPKVGTKLRVFVNEEKPEELIMPVKDNGFTMFVFSVFFIAIGVMLIMS